MEKEENNIYSLINFTLMYLLLFVCINTSSGWSYGGLSLPWEIFRFDKVLLFGQLNIYHLFAGLFFLIVYFVKLGPNSTRNIFGHRNYLKNIFLIYFVPVNILLYFTVFVKNITLFDLGVAPVVTFFIYLSVVFYIQDIFMKNKNIIQLVNMFTILEAIIIFRCSYLIGQYLFGMHSSRVIMGRQGLTIADDLADFFILLFIIAFTRLLFCKKESNKVRFLHIMGIMTSSFVIIFSFRRYLWGSFFIAICVLLLLFYRSNKGNLNKIIIVVCFFIVIVMGSVLFIGPQKIMSNFYFGRFLSSLSLLTPQFESEYGTQTGHMDEISDGWYNVKNNWILGITPFGQEKMQRFKTKQWQSGLFVHNAYLQIWLLYGFLGFLLFLYLYVKSILLGCAVFFKQNNMAGLILLTFMICQIMKNIVWPTAIYNINVTIMYIFIISIVIRIRQIDKIY